MSGVQIAGICTATCDGRKCDLPIGHRGLHFHAALVFTDDPNPRLPSIASECVLGIPDSYPNGPDTVPDHGWKVR